MKIFAVYGRESDEDFEMNIFKDQRTYKTKGGAVRAMHRMSDYVDAELFIKEVLPETPSKDAEEAAENYTSGTTNPESLSVGDRMWAKEDFKAGYLRAVKDVVAWLDDECAKGITADEVRTRFGVK